MRKWTTSSSLGRFASYGRLIIWFTLIAQVMCLACNDIPANNPYDPIAPKEIIRRVNIKGIVINKMTSEPIIGATLTLASAPAVATDVMTAAAAALLL